MPQPDIPLNPLDVFLWPDGFWCFREEYGPHFLRDLTYIVVACDTDHWYTVTRKGRNASP
jgi:hypothetical protein